MTARTWRMRDGLPDQVVQAIAQTSDGYLWLGTKLGLVRFDGAYFLDYGAASAPALREFGVGCILVARDRSLWVGTQGGGVVHLLAEGNKTYAAAEGLGNGLVRALYEDERGRIWAGTDHGVFRKDSLARDGRFAIVDDLPGRFDWGVHAIIGDGHGGAWLGGSRLLHFLGNGRTAKEQWQEIDLPPKGGSVRIWSMALSPDGTLWAASLGGLLRKPPDAPVERDGRFPAGTLSLLIDRQQRLWVGTLGDGLLLLNPDGTFSHALANNQAANNAVLALTENSARDIWVGTQSGLVRFSVTGMHLTRLPGAVDADFGSVAVDKDHSLWVCSRQLIQMRGATQQPVALPGLHDTAIRSVLRDREGTFWVGTSGSGVYRFSHGRSDHYTAEIGTNYIRGFLETPNDGVWIASDGGIANWHAGKVTSYQNAPGSPHAPVVAMASGGPGELWVGTYQGVFLLRHGAYVPSSLASAIGRHTVWALHRADDGSLWIGTENGLLLWQHDHLHALSFSEEMGGSAVLSILEDDRGRIWLGGRTSVLRAPRALLEDLAGDRIPRTAFTPEIFAVSRETGTELSGGSGSVADLDGEGGAWFASHDGPLHIFGADTPPVGDAPPIALRQVSVDGQRIAANGPVTLPPSARALEIDASPISLSGRPGLELRRRLIGFDSRWTSITPNQPATYTNLPPGRYIYRMEAGWRGSSPVTVFELPIVQQSHFYRRPLFLALCVVLLLVMVWLIHVLRVRQMKLRFRATTEERNRMAREIHDTVVQGCIGVSSLLEAVAIRKPHTAPPDSSDTLLDTAREQIALTIVEARDAIWNLRQPRHDGGLIHSLEAMLERMTSSRDTVASFHSAGDPIRLARTEEHELLMSVREALHNATTHAAPSHIALTLTYTPELLTVSIRDDGRGFEPADAQPSHGFHYGLLGMQERMERIGGSCNINSIPGRGAEVLLQLPLRHRTAPEAETA